MNALICLVCYVTLSQIETSPRIVCLDGNFGLVRKKSSGLGVRKPFHADHFFLNQAYVDEVLNTDVETKVPDVCHDALLVLFHLLEIISVFDAIVFGQH